MKKKKELNAYVKALESFGEFYLLIACFKFDCNSKFLEGIMCAGLFLPFLSTIFWKLCRHWHGNNSVPFRFIFRYEICCVQLSYMTIQASFQKWYLSASWLWFLQKPWSGWFDFLHEAQVHMLLWLLDFYCPLLKLFFFFFSF